jgi:hypothetical protein
MRITCIGGGPPACTSRCWRSCRPATRITVLERNPPASRTAGAWSSGTTCSTTCSATTGQRRRIWDAAAWDEYEVRATGKAGHPTSPGTASAWAGGLLDILAARAVELASRSAIATSSPDLTGIPGRGPGGRLRRRPQRIRDEHAEHFGAEIEVGRNKYIWLGTPHVFDTFTFGFEETPPGVDLVPRVPVHRGPQPFTWSARGDLDRAGPGPLDAVQGCAPAAGDLRAHLGGQPLIDHRAEVGGTGWLNFRRLTNQRWDHGNVVLMGDAAHTTHFAIGSGTKLAMQDAIALSEALATGEPAAGGALTRTSTAARPRWRRCNGRRRPAANGSSGCPSTSTGRSPSSRSPLLDRRGEFPAWRYLLHVATQPRPLRAGLRWALTARRWTRSTTAERWHQIADPLAARFKIAHNWSMTGTTT